MPAEDQGQSCTPLWTYIQELRKDSWEEVHPAFRPRTLQQELVGFDDFDIPPALDFSNRSSAALQDPATPTSHDHRAASAIKDVIEDKQQHPPARSFPRSSCCHSRDPSDSSSRYTGHASTPAVHDEVPLPPELLDDMYASYHVDHSELRHHLQQEAKQPIVLRTIDDTLTALPRNPCPPDQVIQSPTREHKLQKRRPSSLEKQSHIANALARLTASSSEFARLTSPAPHTSRSALLREKFSLPVRLTACGGSSTIENDTIPHAVPRLL